MPEWLEELASGREADPGAAEVAHQASMVGLRGGVWLGHDLGWKAPDPWGAGLTRRLPLRREAPRPERGRGEERDLPLQG